VQDNNGVPVSGAAVTANNTAGGGGFATSTDTQGKFSMYVTQGTYDVVARHTAYTQQAPISRVTATSSTTFNMTISVKPATANITGTVTDLTGQSPSDTNVFLLLNNADNTAAYVVAGSTPTSGGTYTLPVAPGTYTFLQFLDKNAFTTSSTFSQRSEYHSDSTSTNPSTFTVGTGGRSGENATMASLNVPSGTMSCVTPTATATAVVGAGTPSPTPFPIPTPGKSCNISLSGSGYAPSTQIFFTLASSSGSGTSGGFGSTTTDSGGSIPVGTPITITNAPSGTWHISASQSSSTVFELVEPMTNVIVP
jgi:hypothetical protein